MHYPLITFQGPRQRGGCPHTDCLRKEGKTSSKKPTAFPVPTQEDEGFYSCGEETMF